MKYLSLAIFEHKEVQAYRIKKNKILIFANVHMRIMVENTTILELKIPISSCNKKCK